MKFESLLIEAGWCCPWAYFKANSKVRTGLLAAKLGVSEDTVRDWKRYAASGQISCKNNGPCFKAIAARSNPSECPTEPPSSRSSKAGLPQG
jgi:hypothetical protein